MITRSLHWLLDHLAGTTVSLVILVGLGFGLTHAASLTQSPTQLAAGDVSTLSAFLTAGSSTLTVNPVKKWLNGALTTGCFHTGSGFVLIQDSTGRTEYASFYGKSCSATNITTLSNLRRGLSLTSPGFTAGTGLSFDAGSSVKVVDYPVVYNFTLHKDTVNSFTGSGRLTSTQTNQAFLNLNCVTTTQRNAFSVVNEGDFICNSTSGTFQQRIGGTWADVAAGATANATESVAGKIQLGTVSDQSAATVTGTTGASTVVQTQYLIRLSAGSADKGKIALLDRGGVFTGSLLALNNSTVTRSTSGSLFLGANQRYGSITSTTSLTNNRTLTNSGIVLINSFQSGSLLDVQKAGVSYFQIRGSQNNGHIKIAPGTTAPTLSAACTNGGAAPATITTNSNDTVGKVTMGGGGGANITSCVVTFNKVYNSIPVCVTTTDGYSAGVGFYSSNTASAITISTSGNNMNSATVNYICLEY